MWCQQGAVKSVKILEWTFDSLYDSQPGPACSTWRPAPRRRFALTAFRAKTPFDNTGYLKLINFKLRIRYALPVYAVICRPGL